MGPDWIINHVGFGNGLYLVMLFPAPEGLVIRWYYNSQGADVDFLHRGPLEPDRALRLRTWNAQTLLEIMTAITALCLPNGSWTSSHITCVLGFV